MSLEPESTAEPKTPLARLLVPLFGAFERESIRYCVLRGFESLPVETRNDVDLAVAPESVDRALRLIADVARDTGWIVVGSVQRPDFRRANLFHPDYGVLPLDLCIAHEVWGMRFADADAVLSGDRFCNGFRVARPGCEAAASLLKALLRHGRVKQRPAHRERLQHCLLEDADGFRACTQERIGEMLCDALIQAGSRGDWDAAEKLTGTLRFALARRDGFVRAARSAVFAWFRTRVESRRRRGGLRFRGGLFVCLLGPDGSGKTTLSRGLEDRIGGLFTRTEQFHSAAGMLPKLKGIKRLYYGARGRPVPDSPLKGVAMPGVVAKPMPALRSATYIVYYGLEYILYRWSVRRKLRRNQLVIFDRYFYDYYLMRVHGNAPRWLLALFSRVIAQPDLLFVMLADPRAIHERKPELTPDEIARQQSVLKALRLPTAVQIDTSVSLARTLDEALEVIGPVLRGEAAPLRALDGLEDRPA